MAKWVGEGKDWTQEMVGAYVVTKPCCTRLRGVAFFSKTEHRDLLASTTARDVVIDEGLCGGRERWNGSFEDDVDIVLSAGSICG